MRASNEKTFPSPRLALGGCALALAAGCGPSSLPPLEPRLESGLAEVTAAALEAHVQRLADDDLEGRGTGTRGYDLAAQYVAEQFAAVGLKGAGDAGGFFQQVPLMRADLDPELTEITLRRADGARSLRHGREILVRPDVHRERAYLAAAPLAFAGFGVSAPDLGYDDYAALDVRGKIVVAFRGAPAAFEPDRRAFHAASWTKLREAVARGAVGFLTMPSPDDRGRVAWERDVARSRAGVMHWLEDSGLPRDAFPELFLRGRLGPTGIELLFEGAPVTPAGAAAAAEASRPQAFDLVGELDVSTTSRHVAVRSANVVGRLHGADPGLADELVVLTAHLDHLGVGEPVENDAVYNGAIDNATGVAVLLEVARGLAALEPPPRRSVVFAAVTAEERGLLGSDFLIERADSLVGTVVANLNLDMVAMLDPLEAVVGFGLEHSTLAEPARQAAARLGLGVQPDPFPEQTVFVRGDQYSFVRRGVPALMLAPAPGPRFSTFLRETYHTPADDRTQPLDFEIGATFARYQLLVTSRVADAEAPPAWLPGDFFGETFAAERPAGED